MTIEQCLSANRLHVLEGHFMVEITADGSVPAARLVHDYYVKNYTM